MLRITSISHSPSETRLIVEGRLLGPWVEELESAVTSIANDSALISIDIAAVSFVDARGLKLLHRLLNQGVIFQGASPFIQELLNSRR